MSEDFILLNGDTLFDTTVLKALLSSQAQPITVTIDRKSTYDEDDMKVQLDGDRLTRIGKDIPLDQVDAESIGMLLFRGTGTALFRRTIEQVLRTPEGLKRWYLSVINELAQTTAVGTCCIEGSPWAELDFPADLAKVEEVVRGIAANWKLAEGGI
jgi:choline kinase